MPVEQRPSAWLVKRARHVSTCLGERCQHVRWRKKRGEAKVTTNLQLRTAHRDRFHRPVVGPLVPSQTRPLSLAAATARSIRPRTHQTRPSDNQPAHDSCCKLNADTRFLGLAFAVDTQGNRRTCASTLAAGARGSDLTWHMPRSKARRPAQPLATRAMAAVETFLSPLTHKSRSALAPSPRLHTPALPRRRAHVSVASGTAGSGCASASTEN
eukprot:3858648-Rhodomonas_salina.1